MPKVAKALSALEVKRLAGAGTDLKKPPRALRAMALLIDN